MKKYSVLLFLFYSNVVAQSAWIDQEVLRHSIKSNPQDIQSRVVLSRYLSEQGDYAQALQILQGVDSKKNPAVAKLIDDIKVAKADKEYLETLHVSTQMDSKEVYKLASEIAVNKSEKLYLALVHSHIPMDVATKQIFAKKISQNKNSILAGSILLSLPKVNVVKTSQNTNPTLKDTSDSTSSDKTQQAIVPKELIPAKKPLHVEPVVESLEVKLQKAFRLYTQNPSKENIDTVLYLYSQNNSSSEQISFLKKHIENHPFDYEARLRVGQLLAWDGKYKDALNYLYTCEGKIKYNAQLLIGQIYGWQGEYASAKKVLQEVEKVGTPSQNYEARKTLAYIARWQGDNASAQEMFARLYKENPSDTEVQEEVLFDQKQYAVLIDKYEALLHKNPNDTKSLERIATLLNLNNEGNKALFYYEKLYKLTKNNNYLKEMGNIAFNLKETQKGLEYWHTYAKNVDSPEGWLDYGKNLYWNSKYKEALEILHKIENNEKVSEEAKKLIALIEPQVSISQSSSDANSTLKAPVELSSYMQEVQFAKKMRSEGKYDEAARVYRQLYFKTSKAIYGKLYAQTLYESGKVEEAEAIRDVLSLEKSEEAIVFQKKNETLSEAPAEDSNTSKNAKGKTTIGLEAERLNDTTNLNATTYKIIAEYTSPKQITLHGEAGKYTFSNQTDSLQGNTLFLWIGNEWIKGGAYVDSIEGKTDINPYVMLTYPINSHSLSLTAQRRNAGFVKNVIDPLRENNTLTMVALSDYVLFPDNDEFWGSMEIAWDEQGNKIFTPQFQYRFWQLPTEWLTWSVSVDGWYTFNSNPTSSYYSPSFADGTYLQNLVEIPLYEKINLNLMGGLGYSYEGSALLYKLGAWIERPLSNSLSFKLGCADYQSISASSTALPYAYNICDAKLMYSW